jgi:multiple sugar transport system ATP-binding protein
MAKVEVRQLVKKFGSVVAVDNVNLEFPDGQLSVMVGPSGCGKTTLLRILAGLEEPTSGEVLVGGKDITLVPPWDRNTAMVFQSYALYPHMNVFKNIAFPLEARRISKAEIKQRVEQTAAILGLERLLHRFPRELSGGQMQRVAIGRAIVRKPEVFLMDEPLSNLDAKLRVTMRAELKRLQKDLGVTTIYVTHDQAEAMTLADQLVVMNNGLVQQVTGPEQVYNCPENVFVAGFMGSPPMNFADGHIEAGLQFVSACFRYDLPPMFAGHISSDLAGRRIVLGVRPEDITVSRTPEPNTIEGIVYIWEVLGKETLVTAQCGDIQLKAVVPTIMRLGIGDHVWLRPLPEGVRLFDGDTSRILINGALLEGVRQDSHDLFASVAVNRG